MLFQFDKFSIDTDRRELSHGANVIHVEPQVFDLLLYFVQNPDRVVSKDELIERVWKRRAVSDAALNSRINSARRAIGDSGERQALIRTVQRRGFLFAAQVRTEASEQVPTSVEQSQTSTLQPVPLALPDKPSIAVLAFHNLSGDPEQEYFADGVVEEIITGLSRIKWLFVIARNSSLAYKGRSVDVKLAGRELGVRYVLEGSVRKAAARVRIAAQLVEAETGVHLWADRYDRNLDDIFALQDEITLNVIGAIEPSLRDAEIARVRRKRPDSLDAYDLVLRAIPHVYDVMPEEAAKAVPLLEQALALQSNYAAAHGWLAWLHQTLFTRAGYRDVHRTASIRHAQAAITLGRDDATTLATGAFALGMAAHDRVTATDAFERALALSPCSAFALFLGCIVLAWGGDAERAIDWGGRALRVSPFDRLAFMPHHACAIAHFLRCRHEAAAHAARQAVQANPGFSVPRCVLAAALVKLGRTDEATAVARTVLLLEPSFTASGFRDAIGMVPELAAPLMEAWCEAGLPP